VKNVVALCYRLKVAPERRFVQVSLGKSLKNAEFIKDYDL